MKPMFPTYVLQSLQGHLSVVHDFILALKYLAILRFEFRLELIPIVLEQEKLYFLFQNNLCGLLAFA